MRRSASQSGRASLGCAPNQSNVSQAGSSLLEPVKISSPSERAKVIARYHDADCGSLPPPSPRISPHTLKQLSSSGEEGEIWKTNKTNEPRQQAGSCLGFIQDSQRRQPRAARTAATLGSSSFAAAAVVASSEPSRRLLFEGPCLHLRRALNLLFARPPLAFRIPREDGRRADPIRSGRVPPGRDVTALHLLVWPPDYMACRGSICSSTATNNRRGWIHFEHELYGFRIVRSVGEQCA